MKTITHEADTKPAPTWKRYSVAVGSVVLGWLAREMMSPTFGQTALPFIFFFPAVALAAWHGGLGPGALATALAVLASMFFFIEPVHTFWIHGGQDVVGLAAFVLSSLLIVAAMEAMHRARMRLNEEIGRRKFAQEALSLERELLATTLSSIGDGVITTDEDGGVRFLNPEAERLTGWPRAEATGRPLHEVFRIIDKRTRQPTDNPVQRVLQTDAVARLDNHTLLISRDGRETPVADSAAPIRYADGSLSGVVLVFRDATVERETREANARLAAIVEHSGDVILTKNLEGIIQSWNRGAERLFGYRADEIIGKPVTTLFPADRLTEEDQILGRLRQGQPVERLETVRVAKDGRHIPVLVSISPLKDVDGHVVGASKVIHNMTELALAREKEKQAAESLRQANEKLASHAIQMQELVQQRTAQLTEMIGNLEAFSYSIVHDMRAPLRAMQSFATLLPEECGQVSPKGQDYIRRIQTGAERMDRLIQDGLNYSRLMRADLPLVTTDAVALLRGMIETYPAFQPPNAEIELVGNFPLIWANEAGLTQCVSNLLNNAVKFVAPGTTPRIRIWTETRHGRVRVLFKDNGIGIEKSAHEKIFQIFYRLDAKYEGTGIGLAIVKKAVERMGGTVGLESERGRGSTFWLELKSADEKKSGVV